jgi:HTH-type transcriptional regulator / antitoxin HigA
MTIETDNDLKIVLARVVALWGAPVGSPKGDELDALLASIKAFEIANAPPEIDPSP